jgi:hypothetical protein
MPSLAETRCAVCSRYAVMASEVSILERTMATLKIYDTKERALAFDLRDLLDLLAPRSLHAEWRISAVKSPHLFDEMFEATGEGGDKLELLAQRNERISGPDLAALAKRTRQVIWGEFVGSLPTAPTEWVTIRAVDSTFYEIATSDEEVLEKVRSAFKDVRRADLPTE